FLVDAGKGVIRTTVEDIADNNSEVPVGTTLARIEQGMTVFSAIHGRLHDSMGRMLRILHRLNKMYLDDEELDEEVGEKLATRADFEGPMDVVPVSDPNIFSDAQRYAQVQAVAQRAAMLPQLYDLRKVEERLLGTMKIPNYQELLAPDMSAKERNAVDENAAASFGHKIAAYADQDHLSHINTHLGYLMSPVFGSSSLLAPTVLPALLDHIKEHIVLLYASGVFHVGSGTIGEDLGDAIKDAPKDDRTQQALDKLLLQASTNVIRTLTPELQPLEALLAQMKQQAIQMMPQPQQDPRLAIEGQKVQLESQKAQQDAQLEGQRIQQEGQLKGQELALKAQGLQQDGQQSASQLQTQVAIAAQLQQHEDDRTAAELQAKVAMNDADNATAAQISDAEIAAGRKSPLSTGTGINPDHR
ncbi:MAG TPA: hypothetical protein VFM34_06705, partial [Moraxellaceae bacterium]|nr:hypothetical protein [Moraxellaceae bacterium]